MHWTISCILTFTRCVRFSVGMQYVHLFHRYGLELYGTEKTPIVRPIYPPSTLWILILSRLQLKRGLFWDHIIQNCTKWSNSGVHGLSYTPFVAKLRCASFLIRKNQETWQYGPTKLKNVDFPEKIFEKLHASHQSWKKQKFKSNLLKFD